MPSVLFISRVFPPASGATGQLLSELVTELRNAGWSVEVICDGTVRNSRPGMLRRLLLYLALYPKFFLRALRLPKADVIVTMTDPPLQIVLGTAISLLKGSRHVHWAQDIYPELAEELGVLRKGGLLARALRWISTDAMKQARCVIAIGECMEQRLIERGVPQAKIQVVPNWASCAETANHNDVTQFRRTYGWQDRFVVMYSGNLGLAHTFDALLDAAERLRRQAPRVLFAFVGDGPRAQSVREQVAKRGLANVSFLPAQPYDRLAVSLAAGDLHVATMRDELCGLVVPSKVYGALATARPCFFVGPEKSETAQLILRHKLGRVFNTSDGSALADAITLWAGDPTLIQQTQERLRSLQFRVGPAAVAFAQILGEVVRGVASPSQAPARPAVAPEILHRTPDWQRN